MALRINTNVAAINTHRQLLGTEKAMGNNMEKLSSGFRINRASDDAAGLSVANRLRTNIRSLTVATRNVSEAKAMVSIAEGSANQVESILERMKELATQAASDNAALDRSKINAEFTALSSEIDRIVNDTAYQGTKLIDGTFGATAAVSSSTIYTASEVSLSGAAAGTYTVIAAASTASMTNGTVTQVVAWSANSTLNFDKLGVAIKTDSGDTTTAFSVATTITVGGSGGTYQVGSGASATEDQIGVTLGDLNAAALGTGAAAYVTNIDLTTRTGAVAGLTILDDAIDDVGVVLGNIGAAVNRMDYTYSNLQITIENFSASESVIRDVDMASEMVNFTKNQILLQAGTAMLAQANMSSQGVLSLMK